MDELENMMLTTPLETSAAEYQELIDAGKAWYALFCLFKMRRFPQGLDLIVRAPEERIDSRTSTPSARSRAPGSASQSPALPPTFSQRAPVMVGSAGTPTQSYPPHNSAARSGDEAQGTEAQGTAAEDGETTNALDEQQSSAAAGDVAGPPSPRGQASEKMPEGKASAAISRRKRKRAQASVDSGDEGDVYRPSHIELRALMEGAPAGEPSEYGHRGLNASMKRLESKAKNLEREQARAMSELIEALLEVPPSKVFMNVAKRLKDEIPVSASVRCGR